MFNHPIWEYCAIINDLKCNDEGKIVKIKEPPPEIVEDWKAKYGELPYEQR